MTFKRTKKKRYHINDKGEPGICVAAIKCRFGGEGDHYPTELDARQAYERKMTHRVGWQSYKEKSGLADAVVEALPTSFFATPHKLVLPPGKYLIGDPYGSVGVDEKGWNDWVETVEETIGWENNVESYKQWQHSAVGALYNGKPVVAMKAALGDGIYWSISPTKRVASDTGLIGAVPLELVEDDLKLDAKRSETSSLGIVYDFPEGTTLTLDGAGNVRVGDELLFVHSGILSQDQLDQLVRSELHWNHGQISSMDESFFEFYENLTNQFHERTR